MHVRRPLRSLLVAAATLMTLAPSATRAAAPAAGTWTMTGSLHKPCVLRTAALLPDGRILTAGEAAGHYTTEGYCVSIISGAEMYYRHSGSRAIAGSMHEPSAEPAATALAW